MAAVLPVFFSTVAAKGALTPVQASSAWGLTQTIGMLLVALAAPVLGAIADYSGSKKRFLAAFAIPGILAAALMVFIGTGDWLLAALLYIVGEIGFSGSIIFYDSLLPHVARTGRDRPGVDARLCDGLSGRRPAAGDQHPDDPDARRTWHHAPWAHASASAARRWRPA